MFDLPVSDKKSRQASTKFRNFLLGEGFYMMQFSVYARFCVNEEIAARHRGRIQKQLPKEGNVRIVSITDRQFGKMEVFIGKKKGKTEDAPQQLLLF